MVALGIVLALVQLFYWAVFTVISMVVIDPGAPVSPYMLPLQTGLLINVGLLVLAFVTWRRWGWWLFVVLQLADAAAYVALRNLSSDNALVGGVLALASAGSVIAARYWPRT